MSYYQQASSNGSRHSTLPAQNSGPYPTVHAFNAGSPCRPNPRPPHIMPRGIPQSPTNNRRRTELPQGTTHTTTQVSLFYKKLAKVKTRPLPEPEWIDISKNEGGRAVHQVIFRLDNRHNATSTPGHPTFAAAKEEVAATAIQLLETNYQF